MSGEIKKELYVNDPLLKGRLHIAYPMISFMQHPKGQLFLYNFFLNLECSKKEEDLNVCYVSQLDHSDISWIHYLNNHRCYLNLKERRIISFSREIEDMALVNYEEMRKGHYLMLKYFCTYDSRIMPRILEILKRHEERSIHTYLKLETPCLKKENCTQVFFKAIDKADKYDYWYGITKNFYKFKFYQEYLPGFYLRNNFFIIEPKTVNERSIEQQ